MKTLHRGCNLSYSLQGQGPPVLFIQGVGVHEASWRPQVEALSSQYQCLTFDNRGIGPSQPLGEALSIELMAEDAAAVMTAAGWDSAHVVGHSMGGPISLQLALAHRPRVRSLSLLCTFARGKDAGKLTPWMFWVGMRTRVGSRRMRRMAFLQIVMPPDVLATADRDALAAELAPIFGHDLADHSPVEGKQLSALRKYDATPRLRELAGLPTLVMSARHDPIARPESGKALAEGIPGAKFLEEPDAAHGLPVQFADRVNERLREHFSQADSGTP